MNRASFVEHDWSASLDTILGRCDAPYTPGIYLQAFDESMNTPLVASIQAEGDLLKQNGEVDVAIVGGGVHGLGMAIRLRQALPDAKITIIDEQELLLGQFVDRCNNSYTRILRSPVHHHLAPDGAIQLVDFLRLHYNHLTKFERLMADKAQGSSRTLTPGQMFVLHTEHLLRRYDVPRRVVRGRVTSVTGMKGGRKILGLECGKTITARAVIQSTGGMIKKVPRSIQETYPNSTRIYSGYERKPKHIGATVHVYGAGMCAAHHVLVLARQGCRVTWVSSRPIQFSCTDFPHVFTRVEGIREWVSQAREDRQIPGPTILPEFYPLLQPFFASGALSLVSGVDQSTAQDADSVVYSGGLQYIGVDGSSDEFPLKSGLAAINRFGPAAPNVDGVRLAARSIVQEVADALESRKTSKRQSAVRGTVPIRFASRSASI